MFEASRRGSSRSSHYCVRVSRTRSSLGTRHPRGYGQSVCPTHSGQAARLQSHRTRSPLARLVRRCGTDWIRPTLTTATAASIGTRLWQPVAVHSCETWRRGRMCGWARRSRAALTAAGAGAVALDDPGLGRRRAGTPAAPGAAPRRWAKRRTQSRTHLQGADEALETAVALGLAHEGRPSFRCRGRRARAGSRWRRTGCRDRGAASGRLRCPRRRRRSRRAGLGAAARAPRTGRASGSVDVEALLRAVIRCHEDRRLAFAGQGRGQIGPALVHALGVDRAVVGLRAMRPARPGLAPASGGPASAAGRDARRRIPAKRNRAQTLR